MKNSSRASRARKFLKTYKADEPIDTNAVDLLADMLHYYGFKKFMDRFEIAFMHFNAEKGEVKNDPNR